MHSERGNMVGGERVYISSDERRNDCVRKTRDESRPEGKKLPLPRMSWEHLRIGDNSD